MPAKAFFIAIGGSCDPLQVGLLVSIIDRGNINTGVVVLVADTGLFF